MVDECAVKESIMQSYGLINLIKMGLTSKFAIEVTILDKKIIKISLSTHIGRKRR